MAKTSAPRRSATAVATPSVFPVAEKYTTSVAPDAAGASSAGVAWSSAAASSFDPPRAPEHPASIVTAAIATA